MLVCAFILDNLPNSIVHLVLKNILTYNSIKRIPHLVGYCCIYQSQEFLLRLCFLVKYIVRDIYKLQNLYPLFLKLQLIVFNSYISFIDLKYKILKLNGVHLQKFLNREMLLLMLLAYLN